MTELREFTRAALASGAGRDEIRDVLHRAGWRADEVSQALGQFAEVQFQLPVPRPRAYGSPWEAFLHLVLFTALYITAFSTGALGLALVDLWFPDPVQDAMAYGWGDPLAPLRWSTAAVLVAFPIYHALLRPLRRAYAANPERRMSPVRKWLTSVTLFIAVAVLIGDGISLVTNLLGGEFTLRFFFKTLVVAGVAAGVLGCYVWDLKGAEGEAAPPPGQELPESLERRRRIVNRVAGGAVAAVLIASLVQAGSPVVARQRAADEQRVQALQSISSAIDAYYTTEGKLPTSLEQLRSQPDVYLQSIVDVSTRRPYEYRKLGAKSYELCATFDRDWKENAARRPRFGNLWNHPAGRHCFRLTVRN
ncbi:MAG: DUF5671 domain-containing protein [Actinomycetota bacterium]